ncbi:PREDICTED: phosphopantothenoylcysteine decarboxylase isoform X3 [Crocodylus porosus]|nr:PREDICTED: phosphopantothenoylcysteine decarboxylase isoform X3 [Crocodylus porosus]
MLVAPLDANTLAKIANGICDNLLLSSQSFPIRVEAVAVSLHLMQIHGGCQHIASVTRLDLSTTAQMKTCVIRAWDMTKPLLFCPAMNTAMWEHPITAEQIERLKGFGYTEIPCVVKKLVCGDEGRGAMAEVWTIVEKVKMIFSERELPTQR